MKIKTADLNELEKIYQIEYKSFHDDSISKEKLKSRIKDHSDSFFVLYEKDKIVSILQGIFVRDDELNSTLINSDYSSDGNIFLLQTLATSYSYRHRGYASYLLNSIIDNYKKKNVKKILLVCNESLKSFYEQFDFKFIGKSIKCSNKKVWLIMERGL